MKNKTRKAITSIDGDGHRVNVKVNCNCKQEPSNKQECFRFWFVESNARKYSKTHGNRFVAGLFKRRRNNESHQCNCQAFTVNLISFFSHYYSRFAYGTWPWIMRNFTNCSRRTISECVSFIRNDEKKTHTHCFVVYGCCGRCYCCCCSRVILFMTKALNYQFEIHNRRPSARNETNENCKNYILLLRDINAGWFCVHVLKITR